VVVELDHQPTIGDNVKVFNVVRMHCSIFATVFFEQEREVAME